MEALEALTSRASPLKLGEPAPDDFDLENILRAGAHAPDHGRLHPWRFIVVRDQARATLGETMVEALRQRDPDVPQSVLDKERSRPLRAPVIVIVAATVQESQKIPAIEQIVSAGTAAQNILLAAHALGFGGFWRTGAPAYDEHLKTALGLERGHTIVGFLYLGTPIESAPPIARPSLAEVAVEWKAPERIEPWGA